MRVTDLSDLTDDGDTFELTDGRTLRLRVESDPHTSVNDFDCYGRVAEVERGPWDGHNKPRPQGFTGRAVKLSIPNGPDYWWEPYYESETQQAYNGPKERQMMIDLLSHGFYGLIVEILNGTDAYGRPIVTNVASLWGIDSLETQYVREIVTDLAAELGVK
jgi:hypothetical protein